MLYLFGYNINRQIEKMNSKETAFETFDELFHMFCLKQAVLFLPNMYHKFAFLSFFISCQSCNISDIDFALDVELLLLNFKNVKVIIGDRYLESKLLTESLIMKNRCLIHKCVLFVHGLKSSSYSSAQFWIFRGKKFV